MFYAYLGLELGVLLLSWAVIITNLLRRTASSGVSPYPLVDFATKTALRNIPDGVGGIGDYLEDMTGADAGRIRSQLASSKMYLRAADVVKGSSAGGLEKSVVLVTTSRPPTLERLRKGMACR
jgi:hypothetical protein